MNDPFAMLDSTNRQGQPQAGAGTFATAPYGAGNSNFAPGYQPQQGQQQGNPFGGAGGQGQVPMQQWQQPQHQPQQSYAYNPASGANFMTQQGPPAFGGLGAPSHHAPQYQPQYMTQPQQQHQPQYPPMNPAPSYSGQPIVYDNIKSLMQPKDPFATAPNPFGDSGLSARPAEPTSLPAPLVPQSSSIVVDFDPFSPQHGTPRTPFDFPDSAATAPPPAPGGGSSALADRLGKRQTQEAQRSQLGFSSDGFSKTSSFGSKMSLRDITSNQPAAAKSSGFDSDPFFSDGTDPFAGQTFANLDDDRMSAQDWGQLSSSKAGAAPRDDAISDECAEDEYEVTFATGSKLGVLMERVDVWTSHGSGGERRVETAVVKLVVENGAADRVNVSVGSSVVAINRHSVQRDNYTTVLDMIKAAPRPLVMRFRRGTVNKDTTQGLVLTRISNGTFSIGNLTSGNAVWTQKYFAFGGAKMDVLQLFVSRAAYHECVIALYEKRPVHTKIQSFRLCMDHKISPIKSKIYKGYGNLHYFSLSVPSLRFIAAKFASEDLEAIKNLWSNAYDAIERKKRMGYPY